MRCHTSKTYSTFFCGIIPLNRDIFGCLGLDGQVFLGKFQAPKRMFFFCLLAIQIRFLQACIILVKLGDATPKFCRRELPYFKVCVCVFFSGCSNSINLNYHTSWVLLLEYMEVSPTNRMDHVITDLLEICKIDRQAVFEANPQLLEPSKRPWFPWLQLYFQFLGFYCSVNNGKSSCSVGDAFPTGPWFHHVSLLECDFAC